MAQPTAPESGLYEALLQRGMSRRTFLKFCSATAGVLALPATFASRIAAALETAPRLPLVWLHGQACGGETAAFLTSASPTTAELLLSLLSVDYQEMLMAAAGGTAIGSLTATTGGSKYLAVIEGAMPREADGMYCIDGGRPFVDLAREVTQGAEATIAVGACAVDGGVSSAHGGVSGAVGAGHLGLGSTLVNLPGCPVNVDNLAATVVHYLTFNKLPPMGSGQRPLFAYGGLIHNQCERRAYFEFGEFATQWGDAGAQQGWCLYKLGCKGPETYGNCPTTRFAEGTSWPVLAGHGCIGCTMPRFWDAMLPAYKRLPSPIPFATNITADEVGVALVGGVAALAAVHGGVSYARGHLSRRPVARGVPGEPGGEAEESGTPDETQADQAAAVEAGAGVLPPEVAPDKTEEEISEAPAADALSEAPVEEPAKPPAEEAVEAAAGVEVGEAIEVDETIEAGPAEPESATQPEQAPEAQRDPEDKPEAQDGAPLGDEPPHDAAVRPTAGEEPAGATPESPDDRSPDP